MQTVKLQAGDVLYREGEESDKVYFVEVGEVEVQRSVAGANVTLATLGKGQMLGEMGVIRDCPRSTTIVAVSPVKLTVIERTAFKGAFGGDDGVALSLLRMICDRLCATNDATHAEPAEKADSYELRLLGGTPELQAMLGAGGVEIIKLPFVIGLSKGRGVEFFEDYLGLPLAEAGQLGERHFQIEASPEGGLAVRDLESWLGCVVNGARISTFERFESGAVATLRVGKNEIVAGGQWSPIRFSLKVHNYVKAEVAA